MNPNEIKPTDLFRLSAPEVFKLHLATTTDHEHPPNTYARSECLARVEPKEGSGKERLICTFPRDHGMRGRAFYLKTYLDRFTVHQVLPERYRRDSSGN